MAGAARKTLALTGTLFGGKATTIFWLLYRMMPRFREMFTNTGAKGGDRILEEKFAKEFGLLEEVETIVAKDGKTSANSKATVYKKELPGLVPSLINFLLPYCVFINLGDLGYALPPYTERKVGLMMSPAMQTEYDRVTGILYDAVSHALAHKDKGLLGIYLSILLTWPEIPSRVRSAHDRDGGHIVTTIPLPEDVLTPKEEAILAHIKRSLADNRKVMLYLEMTAKTDITPRWKDILKRNRISCAVCTTDPDKRIEWFERERDRGTQVILVHPTRVGLGMDLYDWPEVIWMHEHTYSSYLVLQASRRAWRIGQTQPVNVTFYYYDDTMQSLAMAAVQKKALANLRVNGGVIDDDHTAAVTGVDSMEQMLAKLFLRQKEVELKLSHARLYLADLNNGERSGPTAAEFKEYAGLPLDEQIPAMEALIDQLEQELANMNPARTLDSLFAEKTAVIDGIRTGHTSAYAGMDSEQYFEEPLGDEDEDIIEAPRETGWQRQLAARTTPSDNGLAMPHGQNGHSKPVSNIIGDEPVLEPAEEYEEPDPEPEFPILFEEIPTVFDGDTERPFLVTGPNALAIWHLLDEDSRQDALGETEEGVYWIELTFDYLVAYLLEMLDEREWSYQLITYTEDELHDILTDAVETVIEKLGLMRNAPGFQMPDHGERQWMIHDEIVLDVVIDHEQARKRKAAPVQPVALSPEDEAGIGQMANKIGVTDPGEIEGMRTLLRMMQEGQAAVRQRLNGDEPNPAEEDAVIPAVEQAGDFPPAGGNTPSLPPVLTKEIKDMEPETISVYLEEMPARIAGTRSFLLIGDEAAQLERELADFIDTTGNTLDTHWIELSTHSLPFLTDFMDEKEWEWEITESLPDRLDELQFDAEQALMAEIASNRKADPAYKLPNALERETLVRERLRRPLVEAHIEHQARTRAIAEAEAKAAKALPPVTFYEIPGFGTDENGDDHTSLYLVIGDDATPPNGALNNKNVEIETLAETGGVYWVEIDPLKRDDVIVHLDNIGREYTFVSRTEEELEAMLFEAEEAIRQIITIMRQADPGYKLPTRDERERIAHERIVIDHILAYKAEQDNDDPPDELPNGETPPNDDQPPQGGSSLSAPEPDTAPAEKAASPATVVVRLANEHGRFTQQYIAVGHDIAPFCDDEGPFCGIIHPFTHPNGLQSKEQLFPLGTTRESLAAELDKVGAPYVLIYKDDDEVAAEWKAAMTEAQKEYAKITATSGRQKNHQNPIITLARGTALANALEAARQALGLAESEPAAAEATAPTAEPEAETPAGSDAPAPIVIVQVASEPQNRYNTFVAAGPNLRALYGRDALFSQRGLEHDREGLNHIELTLHSWNDRGREERESIIKEGLDKLGRPYQVICLTDEEKETRWNEAMATARREFAQTAFVQGKKPETFGLEIQASKLTEAAALETARAAMLAWPKQPENATQPLDDRIPAEFRPEGEVAAEREQLDTEEARNAPTAEFEATDDDKPEDKEYSFYPDFVFEEIPPINGMRQFLIAGDDETQGVSNYLVGMTGTPVIDGRTDEGIRWIRIPEEHLDELIEQITEVGDTYVIHEGDPEMLALLMKDAAAQVNHDLMARLQLDRYAKLPTAAERDELIYERAIQLLIKEIYNGPEEDEPETAATETTAPPTEETPAEETRAPIIFEEIPGYPGEETRYFMVTNDNAYTLVEALENTNFPCENQGETENGTFWIELAGDVARAIADHLRGSGYECILRERPADALQAIAEGAAREIDIVIANALQGNKRRKPPTEEERRAMIHSRIIEMFLESQEAIVNDNAETEPAEAAPPATNAVTKENVVFTFYETMPDNLVAKRRLFLITGIGAEALLELLDNNDTHAARRNTYRGIPFAVYGQNQLKTIKKLIKEAGRLSDVRYRTAADLKPLIATCMRTAKEHYRNQQVMPEVIEDHARSLFIRAEIDVNIQNGLYPQYNALEPQAAETDTQTEEPLTNGAEVIGMFRKSVLEPQPDTLETVAAILDRNAEDLDDRFAGEKDAADEEESNVLTLVDEGPFYTASGEDADIIADLLDGTGVNFETGISLDTEGESWIEINAEDEGAAIGFINEQGYAVRVVEAPNKANAQGPLPAGNGAEAKPAAANAGDPQGPPSAENRQGPPEPDSNAGDMIESPTQTTLEPKEEKVYRTDQFSYDLLRSRATVSSRILSYREYGTPFRNPYTTIEDASQGMVRGTYLPVYDNGTLWLYRLAPYNGKNDPPTLPKGHKYTSIVGAEIILTRGVIPRMHITDDKWKVEAG